MSYFPSDALDNLFNAASDPVLHREVRATVAEGIRSKLHDPVLDAFRNLHRMTANGISLFNPLCSSAPGGRVAGSDHFDYSSGEDNSEWGGLQCFRASPKFFYIIVEYEMSSFY